jgi:UDPglucose 6-dehydrogenase
MVRSGEASSGVPGAAIVRVMLQPSSARHHKIAVIGVGFVGKAMIQLLDPIAEVITYDKARDAGYPAARIADCDFAVICVDTPQGPDGRCDVSNVREALTALPVTRVLLKSTISPGTTELLAAETGKSICFSPEYIRETQYYGDDWNRHMSDVEFTILGGDPEIRHWMIGALTPLFGPSHIWFQCSALEAEIIKYMENSWLATKVTFVNEFYEICRALDADWHTVREGWLLDPRVGRSHSAVFERERGYSGKCLPKDVQAIIAAAVAVGYDPKLLKAVKDANDGFRAPVPASCYDVPRVSSDALDKIGALWHSYIM